MDAPKSAPQFRARSVERRVQPSQLDTATPVADRKLEITDRATLDPSRAREQAAEIHADRRSQIDYLVMEYLEGETVADRVKKGALPLDQVLRYSIEISDALDEVYVQPFPGPGGKRQISAEGGIEPVWAPNGRELFYRIGDKMMAVEVTLQPAFGAGTPRMLFEGDYVGEVGRRANYDVTPDGQRFLMVKASEQESAATQIIVVENWFEGLKRKARSSGK